MNDRKIPPRENRKKNGKKEEKNGGQKMDGRWRTKLVNGRGSGRLGMMEGKGYNWEKRLGMRGKVMASG